MRNPVVALVAGMLLSGCTTVAVTAKHTAEHTEVTFQASAPPTVRSISRFAGRWEEREIADWCAATGSAGNDLKSVTAGETMQATKAFAGFVNILFPARTVTITRICAEPAPCTDCPACAKPPPCENPANQ